MASNQNVNKVVYAGTTLIDLTGDDVTAGDVLSGKKFHLKSGAAATGTMPNIGAISGILKGDGAGNVSAATAGTDYATPAQVDAKATKPTKKSISLSTTWSGSGPYTQTVTVSGYTITANSKVDIQPDSTALAQMISDGVNALYISNNNGAITAYAVGAAPTAALTVQCTVTEVQV